MYLPANAPWWLNSVVYQIYPRSFQDSNGDGIGDVRGIIQRLPYLADLGVDAIWFCPFFKSPQHDGGYDVSDYRDVEPLFGDLADIKAVISAAHGYGIRIIADIVPNHSSSEHEWFKSAMQTPPNDSAPSSPPRSVSRLCPQAWTRASCAARRSARRS